MASAQNAFPLQANEPVISAQSLLAKDISQSGYLKRKAKILNIKRWTKCYAVLYQSKLYIYEKPTSQRHIIISSLFGYERILGEGMTSSKSQTWTFSLVPLVSTMPTLKFAAASKKERTQWMLELKVAMLEAHNKYSGDVRKESLRLRAESNLSVQSEFLEEPIYKDEQEEMEMRNNMSHWQKDQLFRFSGSADDSTYDVSDDVSDPDSLEIYEDGSAYNTGSSQSDSEAYYESAMFYGNKESSIKELKRRSGVGVFLVRKYEGRQVLSVKTESRMVLFEIETVLPDKTVYLQGYEDYFESLPHLLHHYINNNLPKREFSLSTPFKLAELME